METENLKYPAWQLPLQEVISESDLDILPSKVYGVETLIFERLQQLRSSNDGVGERDAINDALNVLRAVKRERLQFPDWK